MGFGITKNQEIFPIEICGQWIYVSKDFLYDKRTRIVNDCNISHFQLDHCIFYGDLLLMLYIPIDFVCMIVFALQFNDITFSLNSVLVYTLRSSSFLMQNGFDMNNVHWILLSYHWATYIYISEKVTILSNSESLTNIYTFLRGQSKYRCIAKNKLTENIIPNHERYKYSDGFSRLKFHIHSIFRWISYN